ncbi:hypothetical protein ON010_g9992 [Phytophthora cinnamomi]|nr:hypothetical protein ON010_g9992 [Phytophthora cinnamomi]
MGILRPDVPVNESTPRTFQFGEAYRKRKNIGLDTFGSQSAVQRRCKEFATKCGFQLYVKGNSSKENNGGNAKYCCKRLNGRQLNDGADSAQECPCYFNAAGADGVWRLTKANFSHNHVMFVGLTSARCVKGSVQGAENALRNTTQQTEEIISLVETKMLPAHDRSTATLTGTAISTFLRSKGLGVSRTAISRIKIQIDDKHHGDRQDSYQKLEVYLRLMAVKNPGSVWRFETYSDGTFMRAGFIPNVGIHIAKNTRRLFGFDGVHLKGEMNQNGVFLHCPEGNYEHWCWFLNLVKQALCRLDKFTAVSDRQQGLLSAVSEVFPHAGHRFCLWHIMRNMTSSKIPLTTEDRGMICNLARTDCENDYNLYKSELLAVNPKVMAYLEDNKNLAPQNWIKYKLTEYYKLQTYGEITSNLLEQTNNWIGNECRSAKTLDAFSIYFRKRSELRSARRQIAAKWIGNSADTNLIPRLQAKLSDLTKAADKFQFTPCMAGSYSIQFIGPIKQAGYIHPWRQVDLPDRECTCGDWVDLEFPCVHAVKAAIVEGSALDTL